MIINSQHYRDVDTEVGGKLKKVANFADYLIRFGDSYF